jgi:hypothetical protein
VRNRELRMRLKEEHMYNFTSVELTVLAALVGADIALGIGDPFYGMLMEDIEKEIVVAQEELMIKDAIGRNEDGIVIKDALLNELILGIAFPDIIFFIDLDISKVADKKVVFHVRDGHATVHRLPKTGKEDIQLDYMTGIKSIHEEIISSIALEEYGGNLKIIDNVKMNVGQLWELISASREAENDIQNTIVEAGLSKEYAEQLNDLFATPCLFSSLVSVKEEEGEWQVDGLGVIGNEKGLLAVVPDFKYDPVILEVKNIQKDEIKREISRLMQLRPG